MSSLFRIQLVGNLSMMGRNHSINQEKRIRRRKDPVKAEAEGSLSQKSKPAEERVLSAPPLNGRKKGGETSSSFGFRFPLEIRIDFFLSSDFSLFSPQVKSSFLIFVYNESPVEGNPVFWSLDSQREEIGSNIPPLSRKSPLYFTSRRNTPCASNSRMRPRIVNTVVLYLILFQTAMTVMRKGVSGMWVASFSDHRVILGRLSEVTSHLMPHSKVVNPFPLSNYYLRRIFERFVFNWRESGTRGFCFGIWVRPLYPSGYL